MTRESIFVVATVRPASASTSTRGPAGHGQRRQEAVVKTTVGGPSISHNRHVNELQRSWEGVCLPRVNAMSFSKVCKCRIIYEANGQLFFGHPNCCIQAVSYSHPCKPQPQRPLEGNGGFQRSSQKRLIIWLINMTDIFVLK